MKNHYARGMAIAFFSAGLLICVQSCSSGTTELPKCPVNCLGPFLENDSIAWPRPASCPPCPPVVYADPPPCEDRTPIACEFNLDCDSGHCDSGHCSPLRRGSSLNGSECRSDADCQSGLCDRGVCTDIGGIRNERHGIPCEQERSYAERKKPTGMEPYCHGYLCLDGRCRSCTSNSECEYWYGGGTCEFRLGLPGRACGDHQPRLKH